VSIHTPADPATNPLDELERRAGAVFARRDGHPVAVHYGSAAGELAACVTGAGLADRSELTKLELTAPREALEPIVSRLAGGPVAPEGARLAGDTWWCGLGAERVIAISEPHTGERLCRQLRARGGQQPDLSWQDRSQSWAAIAVVGRHTTDVLRMLGVYGQSGDPRRPPPFSAGTAGSVPALWLLESDRLALALVARADAVTAWRALERAGLPMGMCCVGQDAFARWALLERRRAFAASD
jgi:glycine cleavage system aminomethyltransferase T